MIPIRLPRLASALLAAIAAAGMLAAGAPPIEAQGTNTLRYYAQSGIQDFSGTLRVVSKNDRELKKLGDDYVRAYSIETFNFSYKEPGMVLLEGRKGLATARLITNGDARVAEYRIPPGLKKVDRSDLTTDPGKGDYSVDFGVITPSFAARVESEFIKYETRAGRRVAVFQFWHETAKKSVHTVVLDVQTRIVADHLSHVNRKRGEDAPAAYKNRYLFSQAQKIGNVWIPTRVELRNAENKAAGLSAVEGLKVNTGLSATLFKL